ncbi:MULTISPECIES: cell division protein SepF [unclassified Corynebacterium]|uniref:cell division protein SepF n=1 Tax=unclassified Corynebacterium TaxID=2624378 RepID=UPI001EF57DBE|nr:MULTISPECIES: cell division protein SepF [unclassified Corynebacterium]MCG7258931.1 cell division protein SepF [Corynebacterium sp. ACRQK]MCG7263129.1 cell division protein SepF [Corynebacterium sp. ACRQL]
MSENFMDKTKRFFGFDPVESYNTDYYSDGYGSRERDRADRTDRVERDAHEPSYRSRSERDRGDRYGRSDFADRVERGDREDRYSSRGGSLYSSSYADAPAEEKDPSAFVSFTLSSYTQAGELVDNLKAREIVVFSLSGMEKGEAKRVLDFAAGLSRGLDAQLKKLKGVRNFILLPKGVTLAQDQLDAIAETI